MWQRSVALTALALTWMVYGVGIPSASAAPPEQVNYYLPIPPILSHRWFLCHRPDEKGRKAGLRLDISEGPIKSQVIVPGKPEESELVRRITATDKKHMPPAR